MWKFLSIFLIICTQCNSEKIHLGPRRVATKPKVLKTELSSEFWNNAAQDKLMEKLKIQPNTNVAKNLILFVGDGMSMATITAARIYAGQKLGKAGEDHELSFEGFPYTGLSKAYCVDMQTADSACSATAYLTGVKGRYGTVGVNGNVPLHNCSAMLDEKNHPESIMKWAQDAKKYTGFVTTTRVTHATPAGTYAHIANREWESDHDFRQFLRDPNCKGHDIAIQLIRNRPGRKLNVIFGGGRRKFLPNNTVDEEGNAGQRHDGLNLIKEWEQKNKKRGLYIHNREGLKLLNKSKIKHVLGLFSNSHMDYNLQNNTNQPSLKEMTVSAINFMKRSKKGYVLFVEGGLIDVAHHENYARSAIDETAEFDKAIQAAIDITDESDTLIVVTADHAHTMTLSGYSNRGTDVLKLNDGLSELNSMPYMTLSYANGASATGKQEALDEEKMDSYKYQYPALVKLKHETHGGDDVAIYARGPYSHLFTGSFEQNVIPHFMAYAACIGKGITACSN